MKMLSIATVIVVVLAIFAVMRHENAGAPAPEVGRPFLPELAAHVNDVATLTVRGADGDFVVRRADAGWTLDAWDGHPADFATVKAAITGLADLTLRAAMTAKPEKHAQLGLAEPGGGATSTGLKLEDANGAVLADVIVGESRPGTPPSLFVRKEGDDQSWQVDGKLEVPGEIARWADKQLLRVPAEQIASVVVTHPDGETLTVERKPEEPAPQPPADASDEDAAVAAAAAADATPKAPEWTLRDLPEGRELRSTYVLSSLAGALARLDLDGVAKPDAVPDDAEWTEARFVATDGVTYALRLTEHDGKHYVRIEVTRADDASADAAATKSLAERLAGRTFELASWRASALDKRLDDLLKPLPSADDTAAAPSGAPFAPGADGTDVALPEGLDAATLEQLKAMMSQDGAVDVPATDGGSDAPGAEPPADDAGASSGVEPKDDAPAGAGGGMR
ncbi:MAG: DUF4340 domain-containing protein [Planctomycetes bacterium]|nr:DUF4340 domain-containing protein [Planctomycetota bacterium]